MITQQRVQELAAKWFYDDDFKQFTETGVYRPEFCLHYLMGVEWLIIEPENALRPYEHTKKNRKELTQLEAYFTKLCPYKFEWVKHPVYGYRVPQLLENVPTVLGLRLPI